MATPTPTPAPAPNWSELPDLVLLSITLRLLSLTDLVSFSSVCRHWRSFLRLSLRSSAPPLLLNPPHPLQTLSLPTSFFPSHIPPSALQPHLFLSSSHGHLIHLHHFPTPSDPCILLSDPLTASQLTSPILPSVRFPYYYAALTAPPSSPTSLLLLFYSHNSFLYYRIGLRGPRWRTHHLDQSVYIARVLVFQNRRILAINHTANKLLEFTVPEDRCQELLVDVFNVGGIDPGKEFDRSHFGPQLIECGGDLLLLLFVQEVEKGDVVRVDSYKMDFERMEWVEVKRLKDYALFVDCGGKCPVACYMPERWGGMSNCVYLAGPGCDSWIQLPIGGKTIPRYPGHVTAISAKYMTATRWPSPIWVYPTMFF